MTYVIHFETHESAWRNGYKDAGTDFYAEDTASVYQFRQVVYFRMNEM